MLLPSPLASEPFLPAPPPLLQRPTIQTGNIFLPLSSTPNSLLASCRALQTILGSSPVLSCQNTRQLSTVRRRTESSRDALSSLNTHSSRVRKSSPLKPIAPRGLKKRRRDEFEEKEEQLNQIKSPSFDQENLSPTRALQTPKRQRRRAPLAMPLGLSAADFQSLDDYNPEKEDVELDMPDQPTSSFDPLSDELTPANSHQPTDGDDWTIEDDRALVETVLEKLRLSKNEWNDCARILGKDKDSLGRRWKILVGDGNVGLRRGGKRLGRTHLDIKSW